MFLVSPTFRRRWLVTPILTMSLLMPAHGMVVRGYNDTDHKRFIPFPANAEINTSSLYGGTAASGVDLTGVGFKLNGAPTNQCTLISRQHVVFATHFRGRFNPGITVSFVNASNEVVSRTVESHAIISENGVQSDVVVIRLDAPIDADAGISPLPYYDSGNYAGVSIGVLGPDNPTDPDGNYVATFPIMASGEIANVRQDGYDLYGNGSIVSKVYAFEYSTAPGGLGQSPHDCYFERGDSGSPSFVKVGKKAALIGVHTAVESKLFTITNLDTLVPHYATQIDTVLNPMGYRMRPVSATSTTLATTTSTVQATPRRAMPLDYVYQVENTGGELTGNVEIEFQFDLAEAPDSISGPAGWVTYGAGEKWTMRKATLDAAALTSVTAQWAEAPTVGTLSFTIIRRSDTTADDVTAVDLPLAGSYAEWSSGLVEGGLTSDPDLDGLINLHEYAFGGDPDSGRRVFVDGSPLPLDVVSENGDFNVYFPERSDATERGLSYDLEFSADLGGWSGTSPAGFSSTTEPYDPPVSGFVRRVCSWPTVGETKAFVRVGVTLNE